MAEDDPALDYIQRNFPSAGDLGRAPEAAIDYRDYVSAKAETQKDAPPPPAKEKQLSPQSTEFKPSPVPELKGPRGTSDTVFHQYDMPTPPHDNFSNTLDVFKNPMVVLAGLSSLFTRRPLTSAMNYAAGAMKGFHEGQKDVFEQNKNKFEEAIKATIAQNRVELDKYNAAWDRKKEFDWQKAAPALLAQAAANHDEILTTAIQASRWDLVEKILLGREQSQTYLDRAKALMDVRNQGLNIQPETLDFLARQGLTGNQRILMGWFRFPQARAQIEERMRQILEQEQGVTGQAAAEQIARNTASINALQQGAGVLGRREAMVTGAIITAQRTGPRVLQALEGVDRTEFTDLNKLIRSAETRTGSPEEIRLGIAVNTFINNYARASSSITGQTTDTARREAMDLLEPYWAKGQIEAGIDQMLNYELPSELEAAQESVGAFTGGFQTGGPGKGAVHVKTPDEAQKLAPGTHYFTPDGHEYVR